MSYERKGFTLIELLIVIAIIGILASALLVSLGGARQSARDARRIADLKQVQSALELYYNICGYYPGSGAAAVCGTSDPSDWTALEGAISGVIPSISKLPTDPLPAVFYQYGVETAPSLRQSYLLKATLELPNDALKTDIDANPFGGKNYTNSINCTDPNYCISI